MRRRDTNDIKAPDGYLLGGLRLVRRDGTILINRTFWQGPIKWAGEKVWVHEAHDLFWPHSCYLDAAHPGLHIYEARCMQPPHTVRCEPADRPDAKPAYRLAAHKAWAKRCASGIEARSDEPVPEATPAPSDSTPSSDRKAALRGHTHRGWSISFDFPPIPMRDMDWSATSPDYDASYEGPEDGWVASGGRVTSATLDGVKAEIDTWIEENDGCPMCGNPIHGDTGICPSCKEAVR